MRIAIVPARGGSKRIPGKNIKDFLGRPVIAYALEAARQSSLFDHLIVSTDDEQIADTARLFGAEVPFMRPAELADDQASTDAVLVHAMEQVQQLYGTASAACCIYPVNPLLTPALLRQGLDLLSSHRASSAFPVVRYDFPVEQAIILEAGVRPRFRWPEAAEARSQDLQVHYHDAGMFYWFDPARFLATKRLFTGASAAFEVAAHLCQDVNTPEDWALAELKYLRLQASGEMS